MLYACNKRGDQNARKVFAGLVGNFVRGIAWSDAVSDFYADRIACFGLRDIGVFYLHWADYYLKVGNMTFEFDFVVYF